MEMSFEPKNDYINIKIIGVYKESEDFEKIKKIFVDIKQYGYSTMLVDVRDLNYHFDTPKRFYLSEYWVELCKDLGYVTTAVLGKEEKMNSFSEDVVSNRGVTFKLFTDEKEAVDWLKSVI